MSCITSLIGWRDWTKKLAGAANTHVKRSLVNRTPPPMSPKILKRISTIHVNDPEAIKNAEIRESAEDSHACVFECSLVAVSSSLIGYWRVAYVSLPKKIQVEL